MDLNDIYHRQQVSAFNADNAACAETSRAHRVLADRYRALIAAARRQPLEACA